MDYVRNKGYRYKDIAILCGDVSRYERLLNWRLKGMDMPYYLDSKKPFLASDVPGFVLSCVGIFYRNLSYKAMFTYLKSAYVDYDEEVMHYLENYVIRYGVKGLSGWQKEWQYKVPDIHLEKDSKAHSVCLASINQLKDSILKPIIKLKENKPMTIKEHVKCLYEFIDNLELEKTIQKKKKSI